MASTATATLSGREPEPTAERACLPASPNTADHQVGSAIDHLRMISEFRHGVDEADELDDAPDTVKIAVAGGLELGQDVDGTESRRLLRLLQGNRVADLAQMLELAIFERHPTGREHEIPGAHETDIV